MTLACNLRYIQSTIINKYNYCQFTQFITYINFLSLLTYAKHQDWPTGLLLKAPAPDIIVCRAPKQAPRISSIFSVLGMIVIAGEKCKITVPYITATQTSRRGYGNELLNR